MNDKSGLKETAEWIMRRDDVDFDYTIGKGVMNYKMKMMAQYILDSIDVLEDKARKIEEK